MSRFTDVPDSTTVTQDVTRDGLLLASTSKSNLRTVFGYDGLMRRTGVTDPPRPFCWATSPTAAAAQSNGTPPP